MSDIKEISIETLLPWGAPKRVRLQDGSERILRTAFTVPASFWDAWKQNKATLQAAGISPKRQPNGSWIVNHWAAVDPVAAKAEQARRSVVAEASRATDANVDLPRPAGLDYLPYQKAGVAFGLECWAAKRGVLIGDEMGLGKTIQAIGLMNCTADIKSVIIVCPNTLKLNWARELKKWLTRPMSVEVQYSNKPFSRADIVIVNFDIVHKFLPALNDRTWDLRIVDESQYIKNPKARRTKSTLAIRAARKVALTGTPIENRPIELWPILNDLDPSAWPKGNFFQYARRYCAAKQNGFGWDFSGHSNEAELQHKLRSSIMVRRLKKDVLKELPPKQRQVIELDAAGCKELLELEAHMVEEREAALVELRARVELARAGESREDYAEAVHALRQGQGAAFEDMAELRHKVAAAKLPQCLAFIEDAMESGKVLVFAHHLDIVAAIVARFPQAAVITGNTPAPKRMEQVDRFQTDADCNIFVGNLAAAEGLTLTAGTHVIFIELQWVPGKHAQMEDRAHRIGQKDSVLCSYLVLEGSLDSHMARTNVDKLNTIDSCLDRVTDWTEAEVEEVEPVTKVRLTFERVAAEARLVSDRCVELVHQGMKMLAGVCDGAVKRDDVGFSGVDVRIGHALAHRTSITQKQAALGWRILCKYHRQLGDAFIAELKAAAATKE
jgi:SWI/SNF-related matrix-associated actin-dependent regulator 1 of chromatin subfamily A